MENNLTVISEQKNSLYAEPKTYNDFLQIATDLSQSEMIPQSYRNKPQSVLLAIDIARQVQASPLFVMQNMFIIAGRCSWSAQYAASVIRTNFKDVKVNRVGDKDKGLIGVYITAIDKNGNECRGTVVTLDMASKEGWINKQGSKWKTMPEQLLIYRAYSFFARAFCPEKLLGLHDEYEVADIAPSDNSQAKSLEDKLDVIIDAAIVAEADEDGDK